MKVLTLQEFTEQQSKTQDNQHTNLIFDDCTFNFDWTINESFNVVEFSNCIFNGRFDFSKSKFVSSVHFSKCEFNYYLGFTDCDFEKKVRFHEVIFSKKVNFHNAVFNDLADFWSSSFIKRMIFYKTDFLGTTVFSKVLFESNVLFTYTLIEKLLILRGAKFSQGLDLSLSIISGKMSPFDIQIDNYISVLDVDNDNTYEHMVSVSGDIPDKNKRETFRILKQQFLNQNNSIDYLKYSALEQNAYTKQLNDKVWNRKAFYNNIQNYIILGLNYISNNHGKSYIRGIVFTLTVGLLFFYFSLIATDEYSFGFNNFWEATIKSVKYYFSFINPTHKTNHMDELHPNNWFYLWDFIGRAFIAYGIYQTVQAFRKFKK